MGGCGSGRQWGYSLRNTTADYRSIDVREWRRDGLLEPGRAFGVHWSRGGEETGSIRVRVGHGNVRLIYRQRDYGEGCQDMDYPVWLDSLQPWRQAALVSMPCPHVSEAGRQPLRRRGLCLPQLLPARPPVPAEGPIRPCGAPRREYPGKARVDSRNPERSRGKAEGDALADVRAPVRTARLLGSGFARIHGSAVRDADACEVG